METRPVIEVVCAVMRDAQGRVLAAQRPPGKALAGQWEFPGGKIEPGESAEAALAREIREELGCEITAGRALTPVEHAGGRSVIILRPFEAEVIEGTPEAREHSELRWVDAAEAATLPWATADIPIVAEVVGVAAARIEF